MQKSLVIISVLLISFATSQAFASNIDFSKCAGSDNHCYTYRPGTDLHPKAGSSWVFNMFMPDGKCNVSGTMDTSSGNCNVKSLQLSDDNMTQLKMNPGVFAIRDIGNTASPNINYCPVGLFSVLHEDGYFYKVKNVTNYMYPDFCIKETGPNPFPVPEFGMITGIVAAIAVLSVIVFTTRKDLRK